MELLSFDACVTGIAPSAVVCPAALLTADAPEVVSVFVLVSVLPLKLTFGVCHTALNYGLLTIFAQS